MVHHGVRRPRAADEQASPGAAARSLRPFAVGGAEGTGRAADRAPRSDHRAHWTRSLVLTSLAKFRQSSSTSKRPCGSVCHSSECTGTTHLPTNEARALRASKVLGASNVGLRGTFRVPGGLSLNLAHQDLMPLSDDAPQVGGNRIAKSIA